jgi:hypothetical protein
MPGNEFSMPSQDCFGSHDGDKLVEHLAPEDFALMVAAGSDRR